MNLELIVDCSKGGEGSGNFGHTGRPGEVGGSGGNSSSFDPAAEAFESFIVETDSSGYGIVANGEYAGVSEVEWETWAYNEYEINNAEELKVGDTNSSGDIITKEDISNYKQIKDKIQLAAENNFIEGNLAVFRGESYSSLEEVTSKYAKFNTVQFDKLTSTTTNIDIAAEYSKGFNDSDVRVLLSIVQEGEDAPGIQGIQTAPMGVPSNELIMPKGYKARVSEIKVIDKNTVAVRLFGVGKPEGNPVKDSLGNRDNSGYTKDLESALKTSKKKSLDIQVIQQPSTTIHVTVEDT